MRHNHAPFIIAILLLVIIVAFTEECSGQTYEAGNLTYTSYGVAEDIQVKIIKNEWDTNLAERTVNSFIKSLGNRYEIVNIQYQVATMGGYATPTKEIYTVIIVYRKRN